MQNSDCYILVAQDSFDGNDARVPAIDIASNRLSERLWPLYRNTRNRRSIEKGNRLCIYIAGKHEYSGSVIASCIVADVRNADVTHLPFERDFLTDNATRFILLDGVKYFAPFSLYNKIENTEMMPVNRKKWGVILIGGVRRISSEFFDSIFDDEHEC
jgi:hypothetical protein